MRVLNKIEKISEYGKAKPGCVLTIGNFDGVHLGHRRIIREGKRLADELGSEMVAMVFDPHPANILGHGGGLPPLTPLVMRRILLAEAGVDTLLVVGSEPGLLGLSPRAFFEEFIAGIVGPAGIVEGGDFRFGKNRSGGLPELKALASEAGIRVVVAEEVLVEVAGRRERASSTLVRRLLAGGRVDEAAQVLGRNYRIAGRVVAGSGRGKGLGFPTANMEPPKQALPVRGVYAGLARLGSGQDVLSGRASPMPAVFSMGGGLTYWQKPPMLIEAHLLERDPGELEGLWMAMDFVARLRDQRKFESDKLLSSQIASDCQEAARLLGVAGGS
jgi:riboflavin kinase/FMN adenylyltransferase